MKKLIESIKAWTKTKSLSLLILPAILLILAWVFASLTEEIVYDKESEFDHMVYNFVHPIHTPWLTDFMVAITFLGSRAFLLPAYTVLALFLFFKRDRSTALAVSGVALCGAAVLFISKNIFKRERPLEPIIERATSFSYPSGHSFSAFTFAGIALYLVWTSNISKTAKWVWSTLFILLAAIIAFSRIYLNIHFASDVVAGFCLSLIWLTTCYYTLTRLKIIGKSK